MTCPNINSPEFEKLLQHFDQVSATIAYHRNGEEMPTPEQAAHLLGTSIAMLQDRQDSSPATPSRTYLDNILGRLKIRFGIDYKYVDDPKANWKGRFGKGIVEINMAKVTADTPFHEYLHPVVALLSKQNPKFYQSLVSDLQKDPGGQKVINEVKNSYAHLSPDDQVKEALVQYTGQIATGSVDKDGNIKKNVLPQKAGFLQRVMAYVANVFNNLFGTHFKFISPNASLNWLSDYIAKEDLPADMDDAVRIMDEGWLYQVEAPSEIGNFLKKVRDKAVILSKIYHGRVQGEGIASRLAAIVKTLDDKEISDINKIKTFINNSANYIDQAATRFAGIKTASNEKLSKDEMLQHLHTLDEIKNLMSLYQGIDDIDYYLNGLSSEDLKDFNEEDKNSTLAAVRNMKRIKASYRDTAVNLLSQWVMPYAEGANEAIQQEIDEIEQKIKQYPERKETYNKLLSQKRELLLTPESLHKSFNQAMRDISGVDNWLGATISSRDNVSSIVATALASSLYKSNADAVAKKIDLEDAYETARKPGKLLTTNEGEWNKKYLRKARLWEIIGKDDNGQPVFGYVDRTAFHEAYLMDRFADEQRKMQEKYPDPDNDEHKKKRAQWYAANTKLTYSTVAEQEKTLMDKKEHLSPFEYKRWYYFNTREVEYKEYEAGGSNLEYAQKQAMYVPGSSKDGSYRVWAGDMISPADIYNNPDFSRMMDDPYYKELYTTYREANDKLGNRKLKYGLIPQVSHGGFKFSDLKWNGNIKDLLSHTKENLKDHFLAYDDEHTIERPDGTDYKEIPVQFTRLLDEDDLSHDLLSSVLQFNNMAFHYQAMQEAEPFASMVKTVVLGNETLGIRGREVAKTNASGKPLTNAIKTLVDRNISKKTGIKVNERLAEFIDDVLYGEDAIKASFKLGNMELSLNKIGSFMGSAMALNSMAFNFIAGINNNVLGNVVSFGEAAGGKFYTRKQYRDSLLEYTRNIPSMLNAMGGGPINKILFLQMHYDAIQGEFRDHYGHHVSGGLLNKYFNRSALFAPQHMTDHQFQCAGMLALMANTSVKLKDGSTVSLDNAWIKDGNKFKVREDAEWPEHDEQLFRNRLHAINKLLHGNYNKFDKSRLQRTWYGKAMLQFRKHIYTSIKARYGDMQANYELADTQEGYYNRFAKMLIADIKTYKWQMATKVFSKDYRNSLATSEIYALRKTTYELGVLVSAMLIGGGIGAITAHDDDDSKKLVLKHIQLQAARLESDISMYIPPYGLDDFERIFKSPAAMISLLDKYRQVLIQLSHPGDQYSRSGPGYKMGEYKLWHKMERALPVILQVEKLGNPEGQLRVFQQINQK